MHAIYDGSYFSSLYDEPTSHTLADVKRVGRINKQLRSILAVVRAVQKFFFEKSEHIYNRSLYRYLEEHDNHRAAVHGCMQSLGRARKRVAAGDWSRAVAYITWAIANFYVILNHGWPIEYRGNSKLAVESRAMRSAMRDALDEAHLLIDLLIAVRV